MRLVTADVGTVLPQIQVHHKYTWNGRGLDEVGSHRPLGLADPCLSLVSAHTIHEDQRPNQVQIMDNGIHPDHCATGSVTARNTYSGNVHITPRA